MRLLLTGTLLVACTLVCTARGRADSDACWQLVYKTIERSASAPHASFTQYSERGSIMQDGALLQRETIDVLYRDDGLAVVDDSRWAHPLVSNALEPGPPVLGPYGSRRNVWLALDDVELPYPLIGDVHTHPKSPCDERDEDYQGAVATRIDLPDQPGDRPGLRTLWLDPKSGDVRKIIVLGRLLFHGSDASNAPHYTPFEVEFQKAGSYTVVRHVTWSYRLRYYSQSSQLFGEYYYGGYSFPARPETTALGMLPR